MPTRVRCQLADAAVRPDRQGDLEELIRFLYGRRMLAHLDTWEQIRHGPEIVRTLRRRSAVYRAMSSETDGPFLFELGFFRIRHGCLEPIADALPDAQPEALARLLSEFLQPGARLHFEYPDGTREAWRAEGEGEVAPLSGAEKKGSTEERV